MLPIRRQFPERVASQIEGAAVMGLTLARHSEISFTDSRFGQSNFNDFQLYGSTSRQK